MSESFGTGAGHPWQGFEEKQMNKVCNRVGIFESKPASVYLRALAKSKGEGETAPRPAQQAHTHTHSRAARGEARRGG